MSFSWKRAIIFGAVGYTLFAAPGWMEGVATSCDAAAFQLARMETPGASLTEVSGVRLGGAIVSIVMPAKAQSIMPGWPPEIVCTGMYYGVALGITTWK